MLAPPGARVKVRVEKVEAVIRPAPGASGRAPILRFNKSFSPVSPEAVQASATLHYIIELSE